MKTNKRDDLDDLLEQQPLVWRAREQQTEYQHAALASLDTGFKGLNTLLKSDGWPQASLIEIQVDQWGQGELQLLLPAMATLSQQKQQLAWIAPPYIPYAPALHAAGLNLDYLLVIEQSQPEDVAWAAEKCLRHAAAAMVLFCLPQANATIIRRLQLAASAGESIGVLLHRGPARQTPVPLRLKSAYTTQGLNVEVLKSRFGLEQGSSVLLEYSQLVAGMQHTHPKGTE